MLSAEQENSKFIGKPEDPEDRRLGNRRRPSSNQGSSPCNFGGGYRNPKNQGSGRTFFDLQYLNVEHNYNLNIDCGGSGGHYPNYPAPVTEIHHEDHGGGHHKPPLGGGNKPQRPHRPPPHHGGHRPPRPGGGGFFQNLFGGGGGNKPQNSELNGPYQADSGPFGGFFPSPQEFATGLSEGLQGFIGTLPDIGQSFQSILPSFNDFQWPQLPNFELPNFQRPQNTQSNTGGNTGPSQFGPVFPGGGSVPSNPFNRPPSFSPPTTGFPPVISTTPAFVTPFAPTTTTDPDDIIYSDEIKPVHEDYDPITDPYSSKPSGSNGRYRPNSYYSRGRSNQYQNNRQPTYPYNSKNENFYKRDKSDSFLRGRPEGRSFSFPS